MKKDKRGKHRVLCTVHIDELSVYDDSEYRETRKIKEDYFSGFNPSILRHSGI